MNRYWDALSAETEIYEGEKFAFKCPLQRSGVLTSRSGRLRLAFEKKIAYPLKIRSQINTGIAHILDHSYSFLRESLPPGVRTVVTVHDLLPLREPEMLSPAAIRRFRTRTEAMRGADRILADSRATRDDLHKLLEIDQGLVEVLPLGTALPSKTHRLSDTPEGRFIFSIGGYLKRKNLDILPRIFAEIRKFHPDVKLLRAGERFPEALVAEFQVRCGSGALVELGRVSEEKLATLYRSAMATIVPSRYEGFGLPVLEAMSYGCPVVAANATSLPEVGGDVALYFGVDRPGEAADQLLRILNAKEEWLHELHSRSIARSHQFSWKQHFQRLLEIYGELSD